jgi:hypothetical protein
MARALSMSNIQEYWYVYTQNSKELSNSGDGKNVIVLWARKIEFI